MKSQVFIVIFFLSQTAVALSLKDSCPKYFVKKAEGLCYIQTPYQQINGQMSGFREPLTPDKDGLDPQKIALGRFLFFDPILSKNSDMSCATCHSPEEALSDGLKQSIGHNGRLVSRSSPPLWNLSFQKHFFWDGRATTLEEQVQKVLMNPEEMASSESEIITKLENNSIYKEMFKQAYGIKRISLDMVVGAVADFERTLVSFTSPFDQYVFGDDKALTDQQKAGYQHFRSFRTRCSECHTPPLFSSGTFNAIGFPDADGSFTDLGLGYLDAKYNRLFKVPTLRNIAQTAPYGHSGFFASLEDVVDFYNSGGGRTNGFPQINTNWHIRKIGLSAKEEAELAAFLVALTDLSAMPAAPDKLPSQITNPNMQKAQKPTKGETRAL